VAVEVLPLGQLSAEDLAPLIYESEREGWQFVRRLTDDWAAGANRFDRPGEALFVSRMGESLIGFAASTSTLTQRTNPPAGFVSCTFSARSGGMALAGSWCRQ
jgi:hypothetical protein